MAQSGRILDVQSVTVEFSGCKALDQLDFSMAYGELRFVIGPNGAGKTTLLNTIAGKTRPAQGRILFDTTRAIHHLPEHQRARLGIGRKFQTPSIFGSLSVAENLEAAISFRDGLVALAYRASEKHRRAIADTLDQIGLAARAHIRAGSLSYGEKQWLEIGMLLVQKPRLLLLDALVAGMTRRERERTGELLQSIAHERAVLVVEHDMEFVRRFADTVSVLHRGTLLCEGPVEAVQNDPRVIEAYLGRAHDDTPAAGRAHAAR